jgi:transcriptional regulator with XRE-family HTH domain
MPVRETQAEVGARRARLLRARLAHELAAARRGSGLSLREVARRIGVGRSRAAAVERGESPMSIDTLAAFAAVVGLQLSASLHPAGPPVRDQGHLALLERFRVRLGRGMTWRTEVSIPIAGDRRAADGLITGPGWSILVEGETHLDDVQALVREISLKQRDLAVTRSLLLVSDTRHNRRVVRAEPALAQRFPVPTRAALAALASGRDPGGDALVII